MTDTCDVLVVGSGLAGSMAAVAALEGGAGVVLVERATRRPGWGNSMITGGALHAVLQDPRTPPEQLVRMMTELTDGCTDPDVVQAWAANASRTIEWIEAHGADLMSDPTQSHRAKVFSPVRVTEPGTQYRGFGTPNFLAQLRDRFVAGGGQVVQPARARRLEAASGERRWRVHMTAPAGEIAVEAGGVILADGGFQANRALMRRYVGTDRYRLRATGMGEGDGLRMGLSVGGQTINMNGFYGHILSRQALERDDLWPYPILDGLAAVGIVVTEDGTRLVDEAHGGVTTTNAIAWSDSPEGCWLVCDSDAWDGEGRGGVTPPNPYIGEHGGTVVSHETLDGLARACGIDPAGLTETVAALHEGRAKPERTGTVKVGTAPFFAIPVVAGVTFTFGGLRVDGSARVLDGGAQPIGGVYAAGGTMGGLHGGPRVGYAGGLLEAAVFGLIAGETAAAERTGAR